MTMTTKMNIICLFLFFRVGLSIRPNLIVGRGLGEGLPARKGRNLSWTGTLGFSCLDLVALCPI